MPLFGVLCDNVESRSLGVINEDTCYVKSLISIAQNVGGGADSSSSAPAAVALPAPAAEDLAAAFRRVSIVIYNNQSLCQIV